MSESSRPTSGQIAEGLGALAVITVALVGIPVLLASIVGWPLPHHVPTTGQLHTALTSQVPDGFWPKALAVVAWLGWAYFLVSLATGVVDVVRFRRRGTWRRAAGRTSMAALVSAVIVLASIRGLVPAQSTTALPVTVVLAVSTAPIPAVAGQPATAVYTVVPGDCLWDIAVAHYGDGEQWHAIYTANEGVLQADGRALESSNWIYPGWKLTIPSAATPVSAPSVAPPTADGAPAAASTTTYTVVLGDSLWAIAAAHYGDGDQWHAIYTANEGASQPDGQVLSDPSLIYPGWKLTIPQTAEAAPPVTTPVVPPTVSTAPAPPVAAPAPVHLTPVPVPGHEAHAAAVPQHQPPKNGHTPTTVPTRLPAPVHISAPTSSAPANSGGADQTNGHDLRADSGSAADLPAVVIGGLGVLASAVIARSLRRRRRIARVGLRPGDLIASSSSQVRDLESALAALIDTPTVDWLDAAMRHLAQVDKDDPGIVPPVRLVRVGGHGVDLILAEASGTAPGAFRVAEDGWVWTLPATTDPADLAGTSGSDPWFAVLVPVGEDDDGMTYLAPVAPGTILPVTGPGADGVVAAMAAAASWSGSEHLTVTADPAVATEAVTSHAGTTRTRILFLGSPAGLHPAVAVTVGILTTHEMPATDLSVHCAGDGTVEIVPTQLRLRPCHLTAAAQEAIFEATATADTRTSPEVPAYQVVLSPAGVDRASDLEVRLLTNTPAIVGGDIAERPQSRHFELVALLALSGGVSKEDVRAAIYGTGSSVENISRIASQTRKMLGEDPAGQLYLPDASTRGVLTLSPRITTDLKRLCDDVGAAATAEPGEATALYIAGLDLIASTPGTTIDHPWSWWIHYAPIAERAALQAACNLARLIVDTGGDLDAARHGINQARALAPYAEELYRSAIELAGVTGNLSWAQREWDDLRRMLHDLCPGTAPSPATEAVYHSVMQPNSLLPAAGR